MTADEYFKAHLPHRVNLLTTFRDRYSLTRPAKPGRRKLNPEEARDLFRCAKDIAMLMVRFFCDEMGLHLPEGQSQPRARRKHKGNGKSVEGWGPRVPKTIQLKPEDAQSDPRYGKLVTVLKAANRAVVHINEVDVDHPIKQDADLEDLYDVIDWVEELIESNIYSPNGESLEKAMMLANNDMMPPAAFTAFA